MYGVRIMSNEKGLVSLALIKTTWEEQKKDSIDMFVPFVLYTIADLKQNDIISITDTRNKLFSDFGIDIYNNVIETILKRLSFGVSDLYIKKEKGVFYRSDLKINIEEFDSKRKYYFSSQSQVISYFVDFLNSKEINFEIEVAEKELISYLCKYGRNLINDEESTNNKDTTIWTKRVGEFVEYTHNTNTQLFEYLIDIAKGGMLFNVYFNVNYKIKTSNKFKNTKIYFDTPLLMYILNYSGDALQKTVKELRDLLINNGASIHSFEHNLEELKGILEAYVKRYRQGTLNTSYNFDYLIENDVKPEKIETDIMSLRYMLKDEYIIIEDTPNYDIQWKTVGEIAFNNYLSENISYKKDDRRDNDVKSIASIYRLRSRSEYHKYETCEALFVATNSSLVYYTQKYFKEIECKRGIPAIVDDTFLTSLLWVKYVHNDNTIPTLKLISDALAAQEPPKSFWDSFNVKIEELQSRGEITEDEVLDLKYGTFSKRNMFDATEGDISKMNHETVLEVRRMNFRLEHKEVVAEKDRAVEEKNRIKNEKEEYKKKYEEEHHKLIKQQSVPYLNKLLKFKKKANVISLLLICVVIYFVVLLFTKIFNLFSSYMLIINLGVTGAIIAIGSVVNKFIDKYLSKQNEKIGKLLFDYYHRKIYRIIEKNDKQNFIEITAYIEDKLEKAPK